MKKLFSVLLVLVLVCSVSAAGALTVTSLSELQRIIEHNSPGDLLGPDPCTVQLSGTILDIEYARQSNHFNITLQVDDPKAYTPLGYDAPILNVHFRLHDVYMSFKVGDRIDVTGELNSLYSSVMIPWILAETINGSDEF